MRLIKEEDVDGKINWQGAVEALRLGHLGARAEQQDVFLGMQGQILLNRSANIHGLGFGVKAVSVFEGNAQNGLPTVQGAMMVFDHQNGSLKGLIENSLITKLKTAADSVLGAKLLANPKSKHLLIVGTGAVARSLIDAYSENFSSLNRISIWGRDHKKAQDLACQNELVSAVQDLEDCAKYADIISTATLSQSPIIKGQWLQAGVHLDLIGAFKSDMREADDEALLRSQIFVDSYQSTIDHIGEIMIPLKNGVIKRSDILNDLYGLVQNEGAKRTDAKAITLFKNGGGAHLDLMMANYILNAMDS